MTLKEFINQYPRNERVEVRQRLAKKAGVAEVTVRSWANGNKEMSPRYFEAVKEFTEGKVTVFRTDCMPIC